MSAGREVQEAKMSIEESHRILTAKGMPFETEEIVIRGVMTRCWKNAHNSLREIFVKSRAFGDRDYLVYEDERLTYEDNYRRAVTLANRLIDDFGVKKGDRVIIAMRNYNEWPTCFWAITLTGAVAVPLNAWWTGHELQYGIEDSGAHVVFADMQRALLIDEHSEGLALELIIAKPEAGMPAGAQALEDVIGHVADDPALPEVDIGPEDNATLFYTSGTTGQPKGALGTHRNICTNVMSGAFAGARTFLRDSGELPEPPAEPPHMKPLISVPFFHATGCHSILVIGTLSGNTIVMMHRWDPERALELIERERITSFGGVPSMVWQIIESPDLKTRDTSSILGVGYGGAPAAPELLTRIREELGPIGASNGYGMTETSSITTSNAGLNYENNPSSVGHPVAVCDLRVVDEKTGKDVPAGEIGELWIKGPNVVKEYWNKPEATAETFTDGWCHSGDLAYIDEEGFVYIADRVKDMLIRAGENIYCVEVENALYSHPDIMDAAVVGIPEKILGEEVGAVVQVRPGAELSEAALKAHAAEQIARFKVPIHILMGREPLPRNANGKIVKAEVREILFAELGIQQD